MRGPEYESPQYRMQASLEPNCKPIYVSIMSYLFQSWGQKGNDGRIYFTYARRSENTIDETLLKDEAFGM